MFKYTSCGLDSVHLRNGYEEIDTPYGTAVGIHDVEGLHRVIGLHIVNNKPDLLDASEIRFLRKELDLPQAQLALFLDVAESSVRNWEKGRNKISGPADRMLRALYAEKAQGQGRIYQLLECLSQANRDAYVSVLELEESEGGWRTSAA